MPGPVLGRGADLAAAYWADVVRPLVTQHLPRLPHAAGRLGSGSDVLGLDDATSADHDWGLQLTLLVDAEAVPDVDALLTAHLPDRYRGLPTRFAVTWDPVVRHRVHIDTPEAFARSRLGVLVDVERPLHVVDWLALTGQSVLEVTAGPVFADTVGRITAIRRRLAWYPDDVWRYVVAADWTRFAEELPLAGRAGERGDGTGSRVIAARLVDALVHLSFLLERRWPPYPKWAGTMFAQLPRASAAAPHLAAALAGATWREREGALCRAAETLNGLQRDVGLPHAGPATEQFWDRPFRGGNPAVPRALLDAVTDPRVRALPAGVGSVEQWAGSVRVLSHGERRVAAARSLAPDGQLPR